MNRIGHKDVPVARAALALASLFCLALVSAPGPALGQCKAIGGTCGTAQDCCSPAASCSATECRYNTLTGPCTANSQCVSGNCSAGGICIPSATLGQACLSNNDCGIESPNNYQLGCAGFTGGACAGITGATIPCGIDADCTSGYCKASICTCSTPGSAQTSCSSTADCCAGTCVNGTCLMGYGNSCQGNGGAACASGQCNGFNQCVCPALGNTNDTSCTSNGDCSTTFCAGPANEECVYGTCAVKQGDSCVLGGVSQTCVGDLPPGNGPTCSGGSCQATLSSFNSCTGSSDCDMGSGYTCVTNPKFGYRDNFCFLTTGSTCGSGSPGSFCVSGTCNSGGTCTCNGKLPDSGVFGTCLSSADCCNPTGGGSSNGPYAYVCDSRSSTCKITHSATAADNAACANAAECLSGTCNATTHNCACVPSGDYCTTLTDCCAGATSCSGSPATCS